MARKKKTKRGPGRPPKAKRGRPPGSKTKKKAIKAQAPRRAQRIAKGSSDKQFQGQVLGILSSIAKGIESIAIARTSISGDPAAKMASRPIVGAQAAAPIAENPVGAAQA